MLLDVAGRGAGGGVFGADRVAVLVVAILMFLVVLLVVVAVVVMVMAVVANVLVVVVLAMLITQRLGIIYCMQTIMSKFVYLCILHLQNGQVIYACSSQRTMIYSTVSLGGIEAVCDRHLGSVIIEMSK